MNRGTLYFLKQYRRIYFPVYFVKKNPPDFIFSLEKAEKHDMLIRLISTILIINMLFS